ncbi:MAG: acylneuraminate cytidylyltransferase family protein [Sandarakinorhabdus sp.]|nr:acylneuraminate cytidylyltransferase family protein [Sandarakinorhabdus sp.]
MIDSKKVLAVVPARRGSKGLPFKNIRPLGGKPLLAWPIEAARKSHHVDRVLISTEDAEFAAIAQAAGADAPFLRPAELASDTSPSIDFLLHALDTLAAADEHYDYVALLEPTSPLTEASDIDAALETLVARRDEAEAIVGVTALTANHPAFAVRIAAGGFIQPHAALSFDQMPRRQDIEQLYSLDGSLYISTTTALRRERGFYHQKTLPYVTPRWKSFEVDDLVDFICIEAMLAHRDLIIQTEG